MRRVAVAIPAYNAASTIGQVISQVACYVPPESIFVVDDGSNDRTGAIAKQKGVWILRHRTRRGKGSALRDAINKIIEQNYELIITLDSDLQHDPAEIPAFISASEKFDIVLGKRTISTDEMPFHRFLSNSITTKLIMWRLSHAADRRLNADIEDSQCGYRLYHASVFMRIDSKCRHYDYESDILIKAALAGFSIGSIPIKTIYNGSSSRMRVADIFRFVMVYLKSFIWSQQTIPRDR
jgi:glycosyltransferase involved in cell wall biosynthesis